MTTTTGGVPLYERTLYLVRNAPRTTTHQMMAEACGRTRHWVGLFAAGKQENASVKAVQCLHDYLVGLEVEA